MRIGTLLALVGVVVAMAVAASAALAGPGPTRPSRTVQHARPAQAHPMHLWQLGVSTSYAWAQPGTAWVSTPDAQP